MPIVRLSPAQANLVSEDVVTKRDDAIVRGGLYIVFGKLESRAKNRGALSFGGRASLGILRY